MKDEASALRLSLKEKEKSEQVAKAKIKKLYNFSEHKKGF